MKTYLKYLQADKTRGKVEESVVTPFLGSCSCCEVSMGDYTFLLNNTLAGIHKVTVIQRRSYILKFFTQPVVVMVVTNKGVGMASLWERLITLVTENLWVGVRSVLKRQSFRAKSAVIKINFNCCC